MTGTQAVAQAVRLADVDVMAAYPIRPYDGVMQAVAKLIANGELDAEYIVAEGEHSQFGDLQAASAVGSRVFVGSSGVGWMSAMESLVVTPPLLASGRGHDRQPRPGRPGASRGRTQRRDVRARPGLAARLGRGRRSASTPHCWPTASARTRGSPSLWACVWTARSSRTPRRSSRSRTRRASTRSCRRTIWEIGCSTGQPHLHRPQANEDWVLEIRKQTDEAARRVKDVIREAHADFRELFGRGGDNPFFEEYRTEDADYVLLGMGSLGLPAKVMVRRLRDRGEKVGFIRLKWFRPFPDEELAEVLGRFGAVGVVDRDYSYGSPTQGGVLYTDLRAALYNAEQRPRMVNFIGGLGGRELTLEMMDEMAFITRKAADGEDVPDVSWIGGARVE